LTTGDEAITLSKRIKTRMSVSVIEVKTTRRTSIKFSYGVIALAVNWISPEYYNDNCEFKKLEIVHNVLIAKYDDEVDDDLSAFKSFVDSQLSNVCDLLSLLFRIICKHKEHMINDLYESIDNPDSYVNEGEYLDACDNAKHLCNLVESIYKKKHFFDAPNAVLTWSKVLRAETTLLELELEYVKLD
jgi:hypothetical protein